MGITRKVVFLPKTEEDEEVCVRHRLNVVRFDRVFPTGR